MTIEMLAADSAAARTRRSCAISAETETTAAAPTSPRPSETNGSRANAAEHQDAVEQGPERRGPPARARARLHPRGEREDARREQVAGVEIDEAAGELVDHGPAGLDRARSRARPRSSQIADGGHAQRCAQLGDHEEDRQQVDEPERAERLDEGFDVEPGDAGQRRARAAKPGALTANWIVTHSR